MRIHKGWLFFDELSSLNFIVHGFSTKQNNGVNISSIALELGKFDIQTVRQVHGIDIHIATEKVKHEVIADAIVSDTIGILLVIRVADCVPIFLVDKVRKVIALIHAGWKGTSCGIAKKSVQVMIDELSCKPENFLAVFGPSIRSCCYEVKPDVARLFGGNTILARDEKFYLDLQRANKLDLISVGLEENQIKDVGLCTCCHGDLFYSFRRDKKLIGEMIAFLGLVEERV